MSDGDARLDEIRALIPELPGPDLDSGTAALTAERRHAGRPGGLGALGEAAAWLATWQGRFPPRLGHPRIAIFAGSHGVFDRAAPGAERGEAARAVEAMVEGRAVLNRLCRLADADLRVYEMALDLPTADFTAGDAMTESDCARAIAYGMMAVEQGVELVAVAGLGDGSDVAAAALRRALNGPDASGPAAALSPEAEAAVAAGIDLHGGSGADPFELLRRLGGSEIAAMVGTLLAARMAKVPVLIDGPAALAAAAVLRAAVPDGIAHCAVTDAAAGQALPGALQLGLAVGAGGAASGAARGMPAGLAAATAIPVLRAAAALYGEG